MEMNLDVGRNVFNKLAKFAESEEIDANDFALEMIDLGLKVHERSLKNDTQDTVDEVEKFLIENNKMVKEIMRCVFDRSKISEKLYDSEALITMIENTTSSYLEGKENGS
ncbi:hypothetical protein [Piscirickettsia salmonis]|uniref:hypothetical protein n=1 Tax=Piscirickettsia salmonis TaxID=1238 RepID=UPI0006BC748D|nr:hypothetical protein [Piscirickettsia salmonis]ALA26660.1 phosphomethylpyrimidine kinase [Piscirickettsia salmonis]APS45874.1 hypothetical protein AVI48_15690 [Piscirickettsia salmonis]APS49243.1 hypothetical protein AVI49_16435 [Piscirickettsia salmonis]QGO82369.1 hypothetical protein Psal107_03420 [Piscirickettsia salmonis]QGP24198.1 hypothetical protein Psal158_03372 [Piscirickettsia salmonis]